MLKSVKMETSESSSLVGSRKRTRDDTSDEDIASKKSFNSNGSYNLKILIPNSMSGAIIGKGGETIEQLQKASNIKIKMAKANDFFPGTTDRACLIAGTYDGILAGLACIAEKMTSKQHDMNSNYSGETDTDRSMGSDLQIKIIVPDSTAGKIIGKGGSMIRKIQDDTGATIQISKKSDTLYERCISVKGDKDNTLEACALVLVKICDDPMGNTSLNISYSDGAPRMNNSSGSLKASPFQHDNSSFPLDSLVKQTRTSFENLIDCQPRLPNMGSISLNFNGGNILTQASTKKIMDHIRGILRNSRFSEQAICEILDATSTLAHYGVLGMGVGFPPTTPAMY